MTSGSYVASSFFFVVRNLFTQFVTGMTFSGFGFFLPLFGSFLQLENLHWNFKTVVLNGLQSTHLRLQTSSAARGGKDRKELHLMVLDLQCRTTTTTTFIINSCITYVIKSHSPHCSHVKVNVCPMPMIQGWTLH